MNVSDNTLKEKLNHDILKAVESGDLDKVKIALEQGADLEWRCQNHLIESPLNDAVCLGHFSIVKFLIENKANVDVRSGLGGMTPLQNAVLLNKVEIVQYLLQHEPDLEERILSDGTSLHYAAAFNYFEILKMLVEAGADVEARDRKGMTPIMEAAKKSNGESNSTIGKISIQSSSFNACIYIIY